MHTYYFIDDLLQENCNLHLYLHLVILQTLLSKATYNEDYVKITVYKVILLKEANRHRKCLYYQALGIVQTSTS